MVGQQIRVTVTILNAGNGYDPPELVSLGSMIPSDTFDRGPKGCAFLDGGANCPVVGLRSGQKTSVVFAITPGWFPGGGGSDLIFRNAVRPQRAAGRAAVLGTGVGGRRHCVTGAADLRRPKRHTVTGGGRHRFVAARDLGCAEQPGGRVQLNAARTRRFPVRTRSPVG